VQRASSRKAAADAGTVVFGRSAGEACLAFNLVQRELNLGQSNLRNGIAVSP